MTSWTSFRSDGQKTKGSHTHTHFCCHCTNLLKTPATYINVKIYMSFTVIQTYLGEEITALWPTSWRQQPPGWITIVQAQSAEVTVRTINNLSFLTAQHRFQSWPFHAAATGDHQLRDARQITFDRSETSRRSLTHRGCKHSDPHWRTEKQHSRLFIISLYIYSACHIVSCLLIMKPTQYSPGCINYQTIY